jgi:hypothetical protein
VLNHRVFHKERSFHVDSGSLNEPNSNSNRGSGDE